MLLADLGSLRVTSDMQFNIPDVRVRIILTRNTFTNWEVFCSVLPFSLPLFPSLFLFSLSFSPSPPLSLSLLSLSFSHSPSSPFLPQDASLADLQEAFYDHFNVSLTAIQLILAGAGDNWQSARKEASSPYHILHPLGFDVQLKKSLLPNDTNLPRYKHIFL